MVKQNILVTGTSSGFGLLTVKTLANKGHTLLAGMRDIDSRNKDVADEITGYGQDSTGSVHVIEMDVTNEESVNSAANKALDIAGQIDVVINNAGIGCGGWLEGFTADQFQKIFDVNLFGVQRVNRAVLKDMRKRKSGLLIHLSSIIGRIIMPFSGPYIASKFALEALAESYHYELGQFGIESIIVEPGGYGTNFISGMLQPADKQTVSSYGSLADAPDKIWNGINEQMQGENAPNPQDIADAIAKIIDMPKGARPLRTIVDKLMGGAGVDKINDVCSEVQKQLMTSMNQ